LESAATARGRRVFNPSQMNCFILFATPFIHKKQQPALQFSRQPGEVSGEPASLVAAGDDSRLKRRLVAVGMPVT
jgi:hypothetical protein